MFLQLNNLQLKVSSDSVLIKLDTTSETIDLHHLHVVDQRVAVLPGVVAGAAEGGHGDHLGHVEVSQGCGEECHRIIEQRSVSLKQLSWSQDQDTSLVLLSEAAVDTDGWYSKLNWRSSAAVCVTLSPKLYSKCKDKAMNFAH